MGLIILALALLLVAGDEISFRTRRLDAHSQGHNAMWLSHAWVGSPHTKAEYQALAHKLRTMRITEAFFHAGPLKSDGSIDPSRCRYAGDLVSNMKHLAPDIRLYAWLGQVEAKAGGPLDLSRPRTKAGIVKTADGFLDMGFGGIHYDIEPIYSGDRAFLGLLKATHTLTMRRHTLLSVAASKPEPFRGLGNLARRKAKFPGYWTRPYFLEVAGASDQIAIMAYDTVIPTPSLYVRLVSWITSWSGRQGVSDVLIGIPTYDKATGSHRPYVENMDNALIGVKSGLAKLSMHQRRRIGIAIYAEWTTSDVEMRRYAASWTGSK